MTAVLKKEGHRLYLAREGGPDGTPLGREIRSGEDALEVALAFGFEDDPGLPENEVWARALSYLDENVGARLDGPGAWRPAEGATPGRRLDASVQKLLEMRETLALLDEAAPALGRLLAGDAEALDGFDAALAALGARIEEVVSEIEGLTGRIGRLVRGESGEGVPAGTGTGGEG